MFPSYKNKNILILGLGLLGRGVKDAIFFAKQGAKVTVTDLKTKEELENSLNKLKDFNNINYTLGEHKEDDILQSDLIIRNAGVPLKSPFVQLALEKNIPIDMDESLFAQYCPCPIIGITGTRGKTTTSYLIYEILKNHSSYKNVYLAGNIQGEATLPLIEKVTAKDIVILELSSWQLQGFAWKKISPQIAVFTNIYPDHLNSYANMQDYIADKKNIYKFQNKTNLCIINKFNIETKKLIAEIKSQIIQFSKADVPKTWQPKITGTHNKENIAAAIAVAKSLQIDKKTIKSTIENFSGVPHRLEFVKEINGINFINDTTSTTPVSGINALQTTKQPIILIAGGADKKIDLTPFAKEIVEQVKAVILLEGSATLQLNNLIVKYGGENLIAGKFNNFKDAINKAYSLCLPGDTLLLSPGCASFGMFKNEFDRGDQFKKIVNSL